MTPRILKRIGSAASLRSLRHSRQDEAVQPLTDSTNASSEPVVHTDERPLSPGLPAYQPKPGAPATASPRQPRSRSSMPNLKRRRDKAPAVPPLPPAYQFETPSGAPSDRPLKPSRSMASLRGRSKASSSSEDSDIPPLPPHLAYTALEDSVDYTEELQRVMSDSETASSTSSPRPSRLKRIKSSIKEALVIEPMANAHYNYGHGSSVPPMMFYPSFMFF